MYVCMYVCMYTHISDCTQTVYELPLVPNSTAVKHFYTDQQQCEVLIGYLSLGCRSGGQYVTFDRTFHRLLVQQPQSLPWFLIAFLHEAFFRNKVLCINYTIMITIRINNNYYYTVINNCGRLQSLILLYYNCAYVG